MSAEKSLRVGATEWAGTAKCMTNITAMTATTKRPCKFKEVRMTNDEYVKNALVTESKDFEAIGARLANPENIRLLHAAIGLCTESGEVQDALKKHLFYGKPLDKVNLAEELGDIFWYMAILADTLGVSFDEIQEKNIAKLKARYGAKFSEAAALNRDLDTERKILEG